MTADRRSQTDRATLTQTLSDGGFAAWERCNWQENLFAPQFQIVQALTEDGRTASGADTFRDVALQRCLSETAEIVALRASREGRGPALPRRFEPQVDGIAAAPTALAAREYAVLEACERQAVVQWWLGRLPVQPVSTLWLDQNGFSDWLQDMRRGAVLRRRTDLWGAPICDGVWLMIARSGGMSGQSPILGYGCAPDPVRAAAKALREVLLMEMNLVELYVRQTLGSLDEAQDLQARVHGIARRIPAILPAAEPILPDMPDRARRPLREDGSLTHAVTDWLGEDVALMEIKAPGCAETVALCQPARANVVIAKPLGSPFL